MNYSWWLFFVLQACFICKQKCFWRCVRCEIASHDKCAAWPDKVIHLSEQPGWAVCWRHPTDWRHEVNHFFSSLAYLFVASKTFFLYVLFIYLFIYFIFSLFRASHFQFDLILLMRNLVWSFGVWFISLKSKRKLNPYKLLWNPMFNDNKIHKEHILNSYDNYSKSVVVLV